MTTLSAHKEKASAHNLEHNRAHNALTTGPNVHRVSLNGKGSGQVWGDAWVGPGKLKMANSEEKSAASILALWTLNVVKEKAPKPPDVGTVEAGGGGLGPATFPCVCLTQQTLCLKEQESARRGLEPSPRRAAWGHPMGRPPSRKGEGRRGAKGGARFWPARAQ